MSLKRYAAKRDANESGIVEALRAVGASVIQLDDIDLVVGYRSRNFLMEVKTARGKLNAKQERLRETWEGQYDVVRSVDDALRVIGAI